MAFHTNLTVDFSNPEVCSFILDDGEQSLLMDGGFGEEAIGMGFFLLDSQRVKTDDINVTLLKTKVKYFDQIYVADQSVVRSLEAYEVFAQQCATSTLVKVYVKKDASAKVKSEVSQAFANFEIRSLEQDGLSYLEKIEADLKAKDVGVYDYYGMVAIDLQKLNGPTLLSDTEPELLHAVRQSEKFDLRPIGENFVCGTPNPVPPEDDLEVPKSGSIENEKDVEDEASKHRIPDLEKKTDCKLEYTIHSVGTLFQYPEYRVVWRVKDIKVGRCRIVRTKVPYTETRTRKRVLYVSLATEKSIKSKFENEIKECLMLSAITVGLMALVSGGMSLSVAIKAFAEVFFYCIKEKVKNMGRCVVPDIFFATEVGGWSPL